MPLLAVIRIRGHPDRSPDERKTLELLRLYKTYHCTLVPDTPSYRGMVKTVEYVTTYGEIDRGTLIELLKRRGRLVGGGPIAEDRLKDLGFNSIEELADGLLEGRVKLEELPCIKPVFRLHPPKGGFKGSVKKHVSEGGELGYRGFAINELLRRMI